MFIHMIAIDIHGNGSIGISIGSSTSKDEWSNAVGIAKAHETDTIDQVQTCVSSSAFFHDTRNGGKDNFRHEMLMICTLVFLLFVHQMFRKQVEQKFGIRISIDVSSNVFAHNFGQLLRVGKIAIMCDANAVWIIGVQGLRFGTTAGSGGGVTTVSNPQMSTQFHHMVCLKDIFDESIFFAKVQTTLFRCNNASSILSAML